MSTQKPPPGSAESGSRRFLRDFALGLILVLASAGALAFLRSVSGYRAFALDEGAVDLVARADPAERTKRGGLKLLKRGRDEDRIELGQVEVAPGRSYLLVARVTAGKGMALVALTPGEQVARWRFRRQPGDKESARVVRADELPEEVRLAALNAGDRAVEVPTLVLYPLAHARRWLDSAAAALLLLAPLGFLLVHRRRLLRGLREPRGPDDAVFALLLFGLCLFCFHRAPVNQAIDTRYMTVVSHGFLRTGEIALPDNFQPRGSRYWIQEIGGRRFHFQSPAPSVLDAPTVAVFEAFGVSPVAGDGEYDPRAELRIQTFQAALLAAALCVVLYGIARARDLSPLVALGWTTAFAAGTQILSTVSRPYWTHAWGVLLTAAALLLLLRPPRGRETLSVALAATCTAWVFYCRAPAVLSVMGLTFVAWLLHRWRRFWLFAAVGSAWAGLLALFSLRVYDLLLPPYMFAAQVESGRLDVARVGRYVYPNYLLGSWFSPGRGLFVYTPILVAVLWLVASRWRRLPSKPLALTALAVFLGHTWLLVHTHTWLAGASYGARQFADVIVWFFLLAVLASEARAARPATGPTWRRRLALVFGALLVAASVFVNVRGAVARETWQWNLVRRIEGWGVPEGREPFVGPAWAWSWRYPQFLAGLVPPPPSADRGPEPEPEPEPEG